MGSSGGQGKTRTVRVDYMARVEGEGALHIHLEGERVEAVRLEIFEPPRFFEGFLRGRAFTEAPDITARICGICPVAYQMSAVHAMEAILGLTLPPPLRELRRLLYCGEWIESHGLHVFMLHAPDFLGFPDAIHMARAGHKALVEDGLAIKKAGNRLVTVLAGREIHPINVRVGGFYRVPTRRELEALIPDLEQAREKAEAALRWAASLTFPAVERDVPLVSLRHPSEYPMNEGRVVSSAGLDIPVEEYHDHFAEVQVAHSTALQARLHGGAYLAGPLARFNLNFDRLPADLQDRARDLGFAPPITNPFQAIAVRLIEVAYALGEALRIIRGYERPDLPGLDAVPRAGVGWAATEAPRGLLVHRYRIDDEGTIQEATIVPPTSQNQRAIEEDLEALVATRLQDDDATLRDACEQAVRNYDPCISCATHFLTLHRHPGGGA